MTEYINDMHEVLKEGTLTERRAFIRSFVKEIKVTGNEAVLTYSPPIPPDRLTFSGAMVPRTVRYSGRYSTIGRTFKLSFSLKDQIDQSPTPKKQAALI